jgi:pyruvate dehydrogenase E2 component (dihydrolipoamide acetyltransferase)
VAAVSDVLIPDIGEFADVPVIEILVAVGDEVAKDAPLVTIESDKATMEIPSPYAGTVLELLVALEDKVSEGTPILRMERTEGGGEQPSGAGESVTLDSPPPDATPRDPDAAAAQERPSRDPEAVADEQPAPSAPELSSVYAGPAVRRAARENGIDLTSIRGSGRRGRITLADLDRPQPAPVSLQGDGLVLVPWPTPDFSRFGGVERVPLSRIQKLSGANLARNWVRIPHVTHNDEADITELERFRRELNSEQADVKVTMVALLLKALTSALERFPQLNASLDGEELVLKRYYHLGFAADTPQGLVVPVVRDVEQKGLLALAAEIAELSEKARAGRLSPTEMSGASFTLSSLGGIGGTSFTPIINAPEVALLGVVRASHKPVWDGGQFQARLMLPLSLSYDHRVIDGAAAARFCVHLAGLLTDMRRVLL